VDGPYTDSHPGTAGAQLDASGGVMNFDMGPYGAYIWPAYGISAVALIGVTLWSIAAWRRAKTKLSRLEKK